MKNVILAMNLALGWVLGTLGYIVFEYTLSGKMLAGTGDMLMIAFLVGIVVSVVLVFGLKVRYLSGKAIDNLVGIYSLVLFALVAIELVKQQL
jgi:hypothetical protein